MVSNNSILFLDTCYDGMHHSTIRGRFPQKLQKLSSFIELQWDTFASFSTDLSNPSFDLDLYGTVDTAHYLRVGLIMVVNITFAYRSI